MRETTWCWLVCKNGLGLASKYQFSRFSLLTLPLTELLPSRLCALTSTTPRITSLSLSGSRPSLQSSVWIIVGGGAIHSAASGRIRVQRPARPARQCLALLQDGHACCLSLVLEQLSNKIEDLIAKTPIRQARSSSKPEDVPECNCIELKAQMLGHAYYCVASPVDHGNLPLFPEIWGNSFSQMWGNWEKFPKFPIFGGPVLEPPKHPKRVHFTFSGIWGNCKNWENWENRPAQQNRFNFPNFPNFPKFGIYKIWTSTVLQ